MSTTGLGASLKYGVKLFGYFFLIIVFGGAGVSLGAVLAGPEIQSLLTGGSADLLALSGGLLVAGLGAALVLVGTFSITFKLISDAISTGINEGVDTLDVSVTEFSDDLEGVTLRDVTVTESPTEAVLETELDGDDNTGNADDETSAVSEDTGETSPPSDEEATDDTASGTDSPQPEQSAEEIVFGSVGQDEKEGPPVQEAESSAVAVETSPNEAAAEEPDSVSSSATPDEGESRTGQPAEADTSVETTAESPADVEGEQDEDIPGFDELNKQAESDEKKEGSWEDDPLAD